MFTRGVKASEKLSNTRPDSCRPAMTQLTTVPSTKAVFSTLAHGDRGWALLDCDVGRDKAWLSVALGNKKQIKPARQKLWINLQAQFVSELGRQRGVNGRLFFQQPVGDRRRGY